MIQTNRSSEIKHKTYQGGKPVIDYSKSLHYFIGTRRHVFKNQTYHIYIFTDRILMGQNIHDKSPKYQIELTLSNRISWVVQKKNQKTLIQAFSFLDVNEQKNVYANPESLEKLKKLISADFYELQLVIGRGSSAKVFQCKNLNANKTLAIKAITKDYLQACEYGVAMFKSEVQILQQLGQLPNNKSIYFVKLHEVFEGNLTYYLVTDLMSGKTLQNEINYYEDQRKLMPSDQVRTIMLQLLEGVKIMHQCQIIHRDLKPENIMFEKFGQYKTLKIVDFGLATFKDVEKFSIWYLYPKCGTPGYVAPEILNFRQNNNLYSELCDIFSCGVIFYKLYKLRYMSSLSGKSLFKGHKIDEVLKRNRRCQIDFFNDELIHIDYTERQLLEAMLKKEPFQRISAEAALLYDYFTGKKLKILVSQQNTQIPNQSMSSSLPLPHLQLNGIVQIKMSDIQDQEDDKEKISPFQIIRKKQLYEPQIVSYISQQVLINTEKNLNVDIFDEKSSQISINSIDEPLNKQQVPIFKLPNSNNLTNKITENKEYQHLEYIQLQSQKRCWDKVCDIKKFVFVKNEQKQFNKSNNGIISSFYMKDPLSALFKHHVLYQSDDSPSKIDHL